MNSYTFRDPLEETTFTVFFGDGFIKMEPVVNRSALCRELFRLAQREHELEQAERGHDVQVDELSGEVERLRGLLATRNAVISQQSESIRRQADTIRQQDERLAAEESKGRQYCEELAEKAEEIRYLKVALVEVRGESDRRHAAIQAGLAHVEKARELTVQYAYQKEQARLAREALAGKGEEEVPVIDAEAPWSKADLGALLDRVSQMEHDIEARIGPAVAKLIDRLEALERKA